MSLKAAHEDLRPDDSDAAAKWQANVDPIAADMTEAPETDGTPSAALAEYLLSG